MATASSKLIPIELLRRSTRLRKAIAPISGDNNVRQKQPKHIERVIKQEKQQIEDKIVNEKPTKRDEEEKKVSISSNTKGYTKPLADGFIEINEDELDLERTLLGGQSFRWTKETSCDSNDNETLLFTGIIGDLALQLWRQSHDKIAYRALNKGTKDREVANLLGDYFQLKYNLKDHYAKWSSNDKHLSKCCEQYKGFRILRQDPVENVFSFICATNNNIKRISLMIDKMCKHFGTTIETDKEEDYEEGYRKSFPCVERLAQDDVFDCLRYKLGFGYRAKFITETARKLLSLTEESGHKCPRDYLLSLRQLEYKSTCKQLMSFPGIGRKVADCICLMSMDHLNAVPIDCHIYEIVCRNYLPNLRKEHKTLTENVHDLIGDHFNQLHGPLAGWSTSVLFISELKHLKQDKKRTTTDIGQTKSTKKSKQK